MEARFMAFFIAFICVFAANNSEGRKKFGESMLDNGVQDINKHTNEQVWDYCTNELKDSTEAVKGLDSAASHSRTVIDNGVESGSPFQAKRILQNAIDDLPPKEKETILHCLREKKFPLDVLQDQKGGFSYERRNLFTGLASIPRRYLGMEHERGSRRALVDPALAPSQETLDNDYPPLVDGNVPSPKTDKVSPVPLIENSENIKYLVGAVVAGVLAGLGLVAIVIYICMTKFRKVEPNDGLRDEKPLLICSPSTMSAGSSEKSHTMGTQIGVNFKSSSTTATGGSSSDANCISSQAGFQSTEGFADAVGKTLLPLPPGRTAVGEAAASGAAAPSASSTSGAAAAAPAVASGAAGAPPSPPVAPPPPPPDLPTPAPPPPPRGGRRPPPPNAPFPARPSPLGPHHRHTSTGESSACSEESEAPKTKLKPFFWDKVLASPDQSMVWHEIKAGSFQFNEEMMEALFGYAAADKKKQENRKGSADSAPLLIQIIDPKKAQNLAILLKALNVTTEEVCEALKEGNQLPAEFIQTLLKMAPTSDEELKLRLYSGELSQLGPAERFLKAVVDIPYAFKRMESLLFMSTFQEEFSTIKDSFQTLEVACMELKNSRLFMKLLEAVLKTGNRMNDGTYRGGAQAFKLDTLLKLSDVKGTDGKTTLLQFVVHEIIRGEGVRAARKLRESWSMSSMMSEDLVEDSSRETEEYHRNLGLQVVSALSNELQNVKKAAVIDIDILSELVSKLSQARSRTKDFLEAGMKDLGEESEFLDALTSFINSCESDITWLIEEEKRIMDLVKSTGDYFHGRTGKDEAVHLFVIVRDFLLMVDKTCLNMKNSIKLPSKSPKKDPSASLPPSPSSSLPPSPPQGSPSESARDIQQRLFPAMRARQMDEDEFSSDDSS